MFWDKAFTQQPQNIENLLQKEDVTVEELLDDEDILQECKMQKRALIQFLTRPDVIKRLIELTITEPPESLSLAERFKHSNTACEILTFGIPSLDEKLVEDPATLQILYSFLEQEPPLNPLLSSFFSKTFSMLISRKSEQDWFLYQKMCLQVLEFIKTRGNFLDLIFRHFATPVIMDLLLQIIKEVQGGALKKNLYEWLTEQNLVERVIKILGNPEEVDKHNNVAEFLCDLIRHGRSMRQSEHENDSFEPAFIGSNPLLQVIEDESSINLLLNEILETNPRESSIVAGILIVLTLVDESIVDEPASDKALKKMIDKEKENYEKVVANVIRAIAPRMEEFHNFLINPPKKLDSVITTPFGLTRLQICRLFTVLLQTGNATIINAICETDFFNTLLKLFKQYSWNNFLHSEVEKCLEYVFATFDQKENENGFEINPSALQTHVIVNCKIISKLIECWMYNKEVQFEKSGARLGYMGHLIQILKNVTLCISKSDHIGALIVSNFTEEELEDWKLITNFKDGELTKELQTQQKFLADFDPYVDVGYDPNMPKGFHSENNAEYYNSGEAIMSDSVDDPGAFLSESSLTKLCELKTWGNNLDENLEDVLMDFTRRLQTTNFTKYFEDPWGTDPVIDATTGESGGSSGWADFSSNNFADFDLHFSTFSNDLGDKFEPSQNDTGILIEKSDNNANVEKIPIEDAEKIELQLKNAKNLDLNVENQNDETSEIEINAGKVVEEEENNSNNKAIIENTPDEQQIADSTTKNITDITPTPTAITNGPTTTNDETAQGEISTSQTDKNITSSSPDSTNTLNTSQDSSQTIEDESKIGSSNESSSILENGPV